MAFLTDEDLHDIIKQFDLDTVVDDRPETSDSVKASVEAEVKDMYSNRYDMGLELSRSGANRNGALVYNMTVKTVYRLLLRTNRGNIDEAYFQEYERVCKTMTMIAQGKLDTTLTLATPDPISGQVQTGCSDDSDFNY